MTDRSSGVMAGVIPYIAVPNAEAYVDFLAEAFAAEPLGDIARDDKGRIVNAQIVINGGVMMLMDHMEEFGEGPVKTGHGFTPTLVVEDGDLWWSRALKAGCDTTMPFEMQFWGDRYGRLKDPFGLDWGINEGKNG